MYAIRSYYDSENIVEVSRMNNIEEQLAVEKQRLENEKAPKELKNRLRATLDAAPSRKSKRIAPSYNFV